MTEFTFARFLERSLRSLEVEAPRAESALRRRLGESTIGLRVDDEQLLLGASAGRLHIGVILAEPSASLTTSRRVLRELLLGRRTMLDAVMGDGLHLQGPLDQLLVLDDCLHLYLHGAVRSPSFSALFDEFLTGFGEPSRAATLN